MNPYHREGNEALVRDTLPHELPVVDLNAGVLFPLGRLPIAVSAPWIVSAIESARSDGGLVLVVGLKRPHGDRFRQELAYKVGTAAKVVEARRVGDGLTCVVEGAYRARIDAIVPSSSFFVARVAMLPDEDASPERVRLRDVSLRNTASQVLPAICSDLPLAYVRQMLLIRNPGLLADIVLANLPVDTATKQCGLEERNVEQRQAFVSTLLDRLNAESADAPRSLLEAARRALRLLRWRLLG